MTVYLVKVWNQTTRGWSERNILAVGVDDAIDEALLSFNREDTSRNWTRDFIYSVAPVFDVHAMSEKLYSSLIEVAEPESE